MSSSQCIRTTEVKEAVERRVVRLPKRKWPTEQITSRMQIVMGY